MAQSPILHSKSAMRKSGNPRVVRDKKDSGPIVICKGL